MGPVPKLAALVTQDSFKVCAPALEERRHRKRKLGEENPAGKGPAWVGEKAVSALASTKTAEFAPVAMNGAPPAAPEM
jgi:hypothetical protein